LYTARVSFIDKAVSPEELTALSIVSEGYIIGGEK
jgi:hypothetical protein